ncbi:EXS family-domain-containing protein [Microdochium trichocladiopsis]|uniref:EXS family-domain-containing protein n=1 Tax=Microdochium trichocladiopsis TaxID=1682393 RepID=A0A9P9BRV0_9PEZI|nr:EXS family-domain-containing protein [Microdochium trichocladiopsis]KAH7033103.1 EXS family-domain-containing protein [Microdochium trichocladiopsis]
MKFAKELEQDLVPEWRIKYLNYKAGKKYVKAVSRAISRATGNTPRLGRRGEIPPHRTPSFFDSPEESRQNGRQRAHGAATTRTGLAAGQPASLLDEQFAPEQLSLRRSSATGPNYGSIGPSPQTVNSNLTRERTRFELPGPAMNDAPSLDDLTSADVAAGPPGLRRSSSTGRASNENSHFHSLPRPATINARPVPPGRVRRLFSTNGPLSKVESNKLEYGMEALDQVRQREREFFDFMESELDKVESFYKLKEDQAGDRLAALRQQLHEMRNRRTAELAAAREQKERHGQSNHNLNGSDQDLARRLVIEPIKSKMFKPGPNSKALSKMPQTPVLASDGRDGARDYIRRPEAQDVPYRTAKRKLKLALQEFYRGLELLKSYAILNRTAFRKLNKKYDKAVNARPPYRFMNEKVNKAWFVNSDIIDGHIRTVEDLYARYFEKGNKKIAAGKLRRLHKRAGDESDTTFRNGLCIGIGLVFAVQGLVYSVQQLFDADPIVRQQTGYLLQIYGGYFLILCLFFLFCLDAYMWTANKVNYQFIFEFDARNQLDWRQLASFPSFFLMLFGVVYWLNFAIHIPQMHLYYPVVLAGLSVLIILLPLPVFWYKSRRWLAYAHNIELFFCLYANYWNDPVQCNSNHSRLMGFFAALPPIWRALQCIRRYYDTKNVFPHLVNCGKYAMSIMAAVTLSLYRIDGTTANFSLFVTFSVINSIYCSIWDLLMDFSLLQPDARYPFLRDILAIKRRWMYYAIMVLDPILRFGWIFYAIFTHDAQHSTIVSFLVALSEVLRRGMWALFRVENEHCSNVAQYKASRDVPLPYRLQQEPLTERVSTEDEGGGGASLRQSTSRVATTGHGTGAAASMRSPAPAEEPRSDEALESGGGTLRWRKPELNRARSIRNIIASAHRQDFEKKRRGPDEYAPTHGDVAPDGDFVNPSDDEDDDDESGSVHNERLEIRRVEGLVREDSSDAE